MAHRRMKCKNRVHERRTAENVERRMQNYSCEVIDLARETATEDNYANHPIAKVNDHEIRISTMTGPYHWHCHRDSDESFLVLEGGLFIDFHGRTVKLPPGHMITVSRGVRHKKGQSVIARSILVSSGLGHEAKRCLRRTSSRFRVYVSIQGYAVSNSRRVSL